MRPGGHFPKVLEELGVAATSPPYLALRFGGIAASLVVSRHDHGQSCRKRGGGENGGFPVSPGAEQ